MSALRFTAFPARLRGALLLLLLALFATGCEFATLVDPEEEEPAPEPYRGLAVAETGDPAVPYVAVHEDGDWMAVAAAGGRVREATYTTPAGHEMVVHLDAAGFPTTLFVEGHIAVLRPGEAGTVDVALVAPDGTITTAHDLELEASLQRQLQALQAGEKAGATDLVAALQTAGLAVSIATCSANLALAVATPVGTAVALATGAGCVSALLQTARLATDDDDEGLRNSAAAFEIIGYTIDTIGCATGDVVSCLSKILQATTFVAEAARDQAQRRADQIALADGVLQGGSGDIQVTLTWTSTADVDLWVTDPAGERIYWASPTSASGGRLDIDDVDGEGPENVFWPEGRAPQGTYRVQVHHYAGVAPTSFSVRVQAGHQVRTYTGTLADDEVVDVVTFDTGRPLPRLTPPVACDGCAAMVAEKVAVW